MSADLVLVDAGAGLGLIPCVALTAADALVIPLSADDPAVEGAREGCAAAAAWTATWRRYVESVASGVITSPRASAPDAVRAGGGAVLDPLGPDDRVWLGVGPIVLGYSVASEAHYAGNFVRANESVLRMIPRMLDRAIVAPTDPNTAHQESWREHLQGVFAEVAADPRCLGVLRGYVSLRDLSLRARRPMFALSPADGALGSLAVAVTRCRSEYEALARTIAARVDVEI